jgi:cytoskeletal protein RodZ
MNQNENHQQGTENGEKGSPSETGIGALFRNEREKQNLSYVQISQLTRIRPHILEALENEDWDRLPSPVFVKGFIRSYARALGMEEENVAELYQQSAPAEPTYHKPPVKPVKTRKTFSIFVIVLLLAMAISYYLRKEDPTPEGVLIGSETTSPVGYQDKKTEEVQEVTNKTKAMPLNNQNKTALAFKISPEPIDMETTTGFLRDEGGATSSMEQVLFHKGEISSPVETPELTLKINVREKTWVRIFVDDQDPKEYVFRPGRSPEWRAKKDFELVIGNAGGIDLEFNGEKIENLGDPGQVIRLRLPEDYEKRRLLD